jgi:hypothetical protein
MDFQHDKSVLQSCNSGYGDKICNMYHQMWVFTVDLGTIQSCRVRLQMKLQMNSVVNSQAQQESELFRCCSKEHFFFLVLDSLRKNTIFVVRLCISK